MRQEVLAGVLGVAGSGRASMIFLVEIPNRPGSLCALLLPLSGVNVTRIESRPVHAMPGVSQFLLDIDVPPERVPSLLADLMERAIAVGALPEWPDTENGYVVTAASQIGDSG